jgi:light-regulated signal transduction histidine kinase (bacteriophytochrome)
MIAAGLKSWVGFPVLAGGEVVAVLDFFDTEVRPRDERVLALIAALARQIGPVIQNKRAADEIVRLNDILQRNADELEASNKELESFSYSVSHDLRAPLRAVDGYARMLEEDHGASLDAEGRRLLGVVRESSQKMGQLIDDLLAFSRLSRQGLAKRPVDMADLARQVTRELTRATNGMTVDIAALPVATGDPSLLKQVWINLVGNAIKYSGKRDAARVEIGGREENGEAQYWVRDNGVGFDPRYAAKLFGVFQRLHRADEFPGTGVGLAIVHRVVTRHGGRVWAESELGKGASFYFALPK